VDYIPADDAIVLSRDSQQVTVRLRTSTVGEAEASQQASGRPLPMPTKSCTR